MARARARSSPYLPCLSSPQYSEAGPPKELRFSAAFLEGRVKSTGRQEAWNVYSANISWSIPRDFTMAAGLSLPTLRTSRRESTVRT